MKILFVSALAAELKIVKQEIKKINISKNLKISFFECGMGNYKTIFNLTSFLYENKFDFIVNIGVCGYVGEYQKLIQVSRIKNIANNKELIVPNFIEFCENKSIFCNEKIVTSPLTPLLIGEGDKNYFVDMESYGFELVSNKFDIPRIILKIPVDKIGQETKNFDFEKAKRFLAENIDYEELVKQIINFLEKNKQNTFSEAENKIKNKILYSYKWTFSEKIILDKLLNKIIVLELIDLEEFFEENKNLNKKEFFNKLKKLG